jgi:hypothetical protein
MLKSTHHTHGHHLPSPSNHAARQKQDEARQNLIYLSIAIAGGVLLITKPALIILVLALVGYGKLYHVETHERSGGLFRARQSERSLHLGPDQHQGHGHGQKRTSLEDFARNLNFNLPQGKGRS